MNTITFSKKSLVVWVNVGLQTILPLATTFHPTLTQADVRNPHILSSTAQTSVSYTLVRGETVAKKYRMTVEELRHFNQLRTFAHSFDHLQPGDELDVPLQSKITPPQNPFENNQSNSGSQEQQIASFASQAGNLLASHPNKDTAGTMSQGMINNIASDKLSNWLGGNLPIFNGGDK